MPSLSYGGSASREGTARELYRVYISTDVDCVNIVYRGSIVGSPAWAPRSTGALVLPANLLELGKARDGYIIRDGKQGKTFAMDNSAALENESKMIGGDRAAQAAEGRRNRRECREGRVGRTGPAEGRPLGQRLARQPVLLDRRRSHDACRHG